MKMYRHIAINLWILFIVFYGSYGLDDGTYTLDEAIVSFSNEQILKKTEPELQKSGEDYWIIYKDDDENNRSESVHFKVTQILIMITTMVFIETHEESQRRIVLDFQSLDIAQKMCQHYTKQVNLDKRNEYDLLEVLDLNKDEQPVIVSQGKLWIDPFPTDDFCRFTIIQSDNNLPYFIFDSQDFNVSEKPNESNLSLTIDMSGGEYMYQLKFVTPDKAESFHTFVTEKKHVETTIEM